VAFAKAYSGLTDEEFKRIDSVIRKTTLELIDRITEVESEPPRRALLRAKVRVSPLTDG
jgi:hypothetical protein